MSTPSPETEVSVPSAMKYHLVNKASLNIYLALN
jgi:hypothetical protein